MSKRPQLHSAGEKGYSNEKKSRNSVDFSPSSNVITFNVSTKTPIIQSNDDQIADLQTKLNAQKEICDKYAEKLRKAVAEVAKFQVEKSNLKMKCASLEEQIQKQKKIFIQEKAAWKKQFEDKNAEFVWRRE